LPRSSNRAAGPTKNPVGKRSVVGWCAGRCGGSAMLVASAYGGSARHLDRKGARPCSIGHRRERGSVSAPKSVALERNFALQGRTDFCGSLQPTKDSPKPQSKARRFKFATRSTIVVPRLRPLRVWDQWTARLLTWSLRRDKLRVRRCRRRHSNQYHHETTGYRRRRRLIPSKLWDLLGQQPAT
jgi:hypothetical protein